MKSIAALVAAPLVAVVARALMTPQYQTQDDLLDTARYLAALADAGARNDIGALLAGLSAVLYVGAAVALARIVPGRLGAVGAALSVVGAFGIFAVSVFVLVAGRLALESDRAAAAVVLDRIYNASVFGAFVAALVLGAAGAVLLAIALYRSRQVPRAAALLLGIGGAGLMVTTPGPQVSFVVGGALLALAGLTWVGIGTSDRRQGVTVG